MDVLPKALPEQFFLDASNECLNRLAKLVDLGISYCIQEYLQSPTATPAVKARIEKCLGDAVKLATFHTVLHEDGTVTAVRNLNLDAIAAMSNVSQMQDMVKWIEFINANRRYLRSAIPARTKDDFLSFLEEAPEEYKQGIRVNRDYFYDPKAKEQNTGLGVIIRRRQELDIALKGLKYRIAMYSTHQDPSQFFSKV